MRYQNMYAYVGLTYRFAPLDHCAELVKLDLISGDIVGRLWLPRPLFDLTRMDRPQGGGRQRGARGVKVYGDEIYVATFDSIHVLDSNLRLIRSISNERFCDLHEFAVTAGGLVVCSTRMDSIVWCDRQGKVQRLWSAIHDPALQDWFSDLGGREPYPEGDWREIYSAENPTHLNAVTCTGTDTLAGLHNQGVLWSIEMRRPHHDARFMGVGKTHNHVLLADGSICMNDTLNGRFIRWKGESHLALDLSEFGFCAARPSAISAPWAVAHGWLRGLASFGTDSCLVGQCPAKVLHVDASEGVVSRVYPIHSDWRVSVHGIDVGTF